MHLVLMRGKMQALERLLRRHRDVKAHLVRLQRLIALVRGEAQELADTSATIGLEASTELLLRGAYAELLANADDLVRGIRRAAMQMAREGLDSGYATRIVEDLTAVFQTIARIQRRGP